MGTNIFKPVIASSGGTSGGGGAKNYLAAITTSNGVNTGNGDIELGSTTGWSLGNNSTFSNGLLTGTTPTFGSGASGNLSISAISSGVLAGSFSMQFANSGTGAAGDFFASDAFNIDTEDQAKVLTFKFYYKVTVNPANGTFSGTNTNSFGVAFWDVTNSQWIFPAGVFSMTQSSGVGLATGTFQTTSNSTQYRMVIYQANTGGGAITLVFDDFNVGPQTAPIGPVMTDPVAYTPTFTGLGTVTAISVKSWREGKNLLCQGVFTTGTVAGSNMTMTLGFNGANGSVTSDSTLPGSSPLVYLGTCVSGSTTATAIRNFDILGTASLTTVSFSYLQDSGTASPLATQLGTAMQSSTAHSFSFIIPIAGWSSNVQMSNDTDTRVVAMRANNASATVASSYSDVTWSSIVNDTHGSMGAISYSIPASGYYDILSQISLAGTQALNGTAGLQATKNGAIIQENLAAYGGAVTANNTLAIDIDSVLCSAGDLIKIQVKSSAVLPVIADATNGCYFTIARRSGPAVVAATESVNMRYGTSAAPSISNASLTTVTFATKSFDSHNAMSGSTYTFPVSGTFVVGGALGYATNGTGGRALYITVTGLSSGQYTLFQWPSTDSAGDSAVVSGQILLKVNAGDTVVMQAFQRSGGSLALTASANDNYFYAFRQGN